MFFPNASKVVADLLADGAARVPSVISREEITAIRATCVSVSGNSSYDHNNNSTSITALPDKPEFLLAIKRGVDVLESLGFQDLRYLAGFIVPKLEGEHRRDWHTDSWMWEHGNDIWRETPPQVGVLFYFDDAHHNSGAPMIIPSSHRREVLGHTEYLETKMSHPAERTIDICAGDVLLLDPRTTHASSHNLETPNRICLTLWFLLDYANLEEQTRATAAASTVDTSYIQHLGDLYPSYTGSLTARPHAKKPQFPITLERIAVLRHGETDTEIIGSAKQPQDTFVDMHETYTWYYAVGKAVAPRNVLELGVRYAYSAISLLKGADWAGANGLHFTGIDSESDGVSSNLTAMDNIASSFNWVERSRIEDYCRIFKSDTKCIHETNSVINGRGPFDLVHIDGDHSEQGILNEISIAKTWVRAQGVILIDDLDTHHVLEAANNLCADYGIAPIILPTFHGTMLVDIRKRSKYL